MRLKIVRPTLDGVNDPQREWQALVASQGLEASNATACWEFLNSNYSEPHRAYHNLNHISDCFEQLKHFASESSSAALQFAVWFHDVIYDPQGSENEAASAVAAAEWLNRLEIAAPIINQAIRLIEVTDHRQAPDKKSPEEALIVDVDLSILGRSDNVYQNYAQSIRSEYAHVPEEAYRKGRSAVLEQFLQRGQLYHTPSIAQRFERQARINLQAELSKLAD